MTIEELIENLKNESYNSGPDYQKLIDINQEIELANDKLNKLYERYEYLNHINDLIIEYRKEKYNG